MRLPAGGAQAEVERLAGADVDAIDVRANGFAMLDAVRVRCNATMPFPQIGAFAQHTKIDESSVIATEILGRWPMPVLS